jgi:hypothetical protein
LGWQLWGGTLSGILATPRILPCWACYIEHGHSSEGCWHLPPRRAEATMIIQNIELSHSWW